MISRYVIRQILAGVSAAAATATPALAQQPTGQAQARLDEVLVVSTRQHYRGDVSLDEMPQSSVVLDAKYLEELGITRLDKALELSSSVARQNDFGGWWDGFAIRGFAGDENSPSGFLVNGFAANRGFGGRRDTASIERIEILKGPNAALFGRGEPGGTVNIVTKKPQFDPLARVAVAAGRYDFYRVEADVTGGLGERVAARLIGAYEQSDSFRDFTEMRRYAITPSFLVIFSDDTSLSYELDYVNQEAPFDRGLVAVNGQLGLVPRERFLGEPGDGDNEAEAWTHQAQLLHRINSDWNFLVGAGYRKTELKGFSSDAELARGRQLFFTDQARLSRQRRYRQYDGTDTTFRGEFTGTFETGALVHHVVIGADWSEFKNDVLQMRFRPPAVATQTAALPANAGHWINVFTPVYGDAVTPGPFLDSLETQKNWGIYIQDQIDLSDRWKLRVGGRYDDVDIDLLNQVTSALTSQSETQFSPQAGLLFEANDSWSLFMSYGTGYRPNSAAFTSTTPEPEESTSYEAGARYSSPDGNLQATFAIFKMEKSNILTADPLNPGLSIAIGEAESKGVEIDVAGTIPGVQLDVLASYSYVDAEVTKSGRDSNFGLVLNPGDPLLNVPENKASLYVSRTFPAGAGTLTLGANVLHIDDRLGETGVTSFVLPSYTLAGLSATWAPSERLSFTADVKNLFDEEYYPSSYHRLWVAPGEPRTWGIKMSYSILD